MSVEKHPPACTACGTTMPIIAQLYERVELLDIDIDRKRRQIVALQGERSDAANNDPLAAKAEAVHAHYKQKIAPRTREFNGEAQGKVLARLRAGHTVEEICLAIDKCAEDPWRMAPGQYSRRRLSLICRDEEHLQMFLERAEDGTQIKTVDTVSAARLDRLRDQLRQKDLEIDSLKRLIEDQEDTASRWRNCFENARHYLNGINPKLAEIAEDDFAQIWAARGSA